MATIHDMDMYLVELLEMGSGEPLPAPRTVYEQVVLGVVLGALESNSAMIAVLYSRLDVFDETAASCWAEQEDED